MQAGTRDISLSFYTATTSTDTDFGHTTSTWAVSFTDWAHVMELTGKEAYEISKFTDKADVKINIRYRDGVTNNMRFKYNSEWYNIVYVQEVQRRKELNLFAKLKEDT